MSGSDGGADGLLDASPIPGDGDTVPTRLHVSSLCDDGTPAWSHDFLRFIGNIIPASVIAENESWWLNQYIVARLTKKFGEPMVMAVMAWSRGDYRHQAERADTTEIQLVELIHGISAITLYRRQQQMRREVLQTYKMSRAFF